MTLKPPIHGIRYDPVNRCIYCEATANDGRLGREHIIPRALNGNLLLPKSSCSSCAAITGRFEQICLRGWFRLPRAALAFQKNKNRKWRDELALSIHQILADGEIATITPPQFQRLSVKSVPFALFSVDLAPPGIFAGRPRDPGKFYPTRLMWTTSQEFRDLLGNRADGLSLAEPLHPQSLFQMLAKIGHSYAAAEYGIDRFVPLLRGVINGSDPYASHYIGGAAQPLEDGSLHRLHLSIIGNRYLTVDLRLFSSFETPTYRIVVGEIAASLPQRQSFRS